MLTNEEGGSQLAPSLNGRAETDASSAGFRLPNAAFPAEGAPPRARQNDVNQAETKQQQVEQRESKSNNNKFNWSSDKVGAAAASQNQWSIEQALTSNDPKQTTKQFYPSSSLQGKKKVQDYLKKANDNDENSKFDPDETQHFLSRNRQLEARARLAKQESLLSETDLDLRQEKEAERGGKRCSWLRPFSCCSCCCTCFPIDEESQQVGNKHLDEEEEESEFAEKKKKSMCTWWQRLVLCPLILLLIYSVAIYCLPFVQVNPQIPEPIPDVPFNFNEGPLRASAASQFNVQHLFRDQLHAPESLAVNSQGNVYLAIEGGFILYAHLNKSSPFKSHYWSASPTIQAPDLIKIADLNGVKQVSRQQLVRSQRSNQQNFQESSSVWRRECTLDEQLYGPQLYSPSNSEILAAQKNTDQRWLWATSEEKQQQLKFVSHVKVSRCSKPLGTRLSPDESSLYVIDTLSGLYKVNLKSAERHSSNQRLVTRLIDFKANNWSQTLAAIQLNIATPEDAIAPSSRLLNVSMRAVDDLTIDFGAGTKNGDMIYFTVASQQWPAVSFVFDYLEGRPSGLVARYDTGSQQLVILEPNQLAQVRTSGLGLIPTQSDFTAAHQVAGQDNDGNKQQFMNRFGVPSIDENDVFDKRPLHFPNGIELMDDKQALLIADTANKRIVKHYIRGSRRGTSDLWAYTPNYPDNIRRGYDKRDETYWVVGCGRSHATSSTKQNGIYSNEPQQRHEDKDFFSSVREWPMVKKFALKNIYFFGWFIEKLGQHLLMSNNIRDFGYELKMGSSLCQSGCAGMMILQYNRNGDLIRSIHSREFPNDLKYYSQANEIIDAQNQEHSLLLSSPSYNYLTKLTLPTESYPSQPNAR